MNPTGQDESRDPVMSRDGLQGGMHLRALLEEQAQVVALLTQAAAEKQSAILERDNAKIEAAVARETELAERLAALEARRSSWIAEWALSSPGTQSAGGGGSVDGGPVTLSEVLPHLPPEEAGAVEEAAVRLVEALDQLHRINQQNADLIYYSLTHVQTLLGALAGDEQPSGVYGPGAPKGDARPPGLVDWRV